MELQILDRPPVRRLLTATSYHQGKLVKLRIEDASVDGVQEYYYGLSQVTISICQNEEQRAGSNKQK
jgi:hypothetical protein